MTTDVIIYHNPECGTSRNTLAMIRNTGIEPHVIEYLKTPLSRDMLESLIERVVAFSVGAPVSDDDIRGWLHPVVAPQQQGAPTDLPAEGVDLEGLISGIEKSLLVQAL